MLTYDLTQRGSQPLYLFLYQCIKQDIESNRLPPHVRMPSKRPFAEHLGISVITVESAYEQLLAEGYLRSEQRRGYFVNDIGQQSAAMLSTEHARPIAPARGPFPASVAGHAAFDLTDGGMPAEAFPFSAWAKTLRDTLSNEPRASLLSSGNPLGEMALREEIALHLQRTRGLHADPRNIVVGAGAQVLYNLLAQLLASIADKRPLCVGVEDPGYERISLIYERNGIPVEHLPLDDQGIRSDCVRASHATVLHIMPSHQFPTGIVMSASRRFELLEWASATPDRIIVEDDYDCEFRLAGKPVPTLQEKDRRGCVVYTNTFAKSLGPAFRVAYMVLPERLARSYEQTMGFYSCTVPVIDQLALARFMRHGDFERHINRTKTRCRAVRNELISSLRKSALAGRLSIASQDAGLHFILGIRFDGPRRPSDATVLQALENEGVRVAALSQFAHDERVGETDRNAACSLVVQYASLPLERARPAAEAIERALLTLS